MIRRQVEGIYPWPYDAPAEAGATALLVIDMQRDLLDPNGWFALTGGNASPLAAVVPGVERSVALSRAAGIAVFYTVEAHRGDLSDVPANKAWRSRRLGRAIGDDGPLGRHLVQGEAGAQIVDALKPAPDEPIVCKSAKSAFIGTDLDHLLRRRGVRNLVLAGVLTDGAVQCTLRDANDRGYECLLLSDATASDHQRHHDDQIHTLALAGGHYGSISIVETFAAALDARVTP
jgi:nicotinamidase-related amidase